MRKYTRRLLYSGIIGSILGGVLMVGGLMLIGRAQRQAVETQSGNKDPFAGTPETNEVAQVVSSASPAVTPTPQTEESEFQNFKEGSFKYVLPDKYRVANEIIALDKKNAPAGSAILTITKGSAEKEKEYVNLISQLQNDRAATEAPQFLPGQTITIYLASGNSEQSDSALAHSRRKIKTPQGFDGTRYVKVEGLFTYDVTYVTLPNGKQVAVQMNYSSEEPTFDEESYSAVINSLNSI